MAKLRGLLFGAFAPFIVVACTQTAGGPPVGMTAAQGAAYCTKLTTVYGEYVAGLSTSMGGVGRGGGQSDIDATAHLNAMNAMHALPWNLTFSYGRALQAAPQKAWSGKEENNEAAQAAFYKRAHMNGLASLGQWSRELEDK